LIKSGLSDTIFAITSKVISSHTSAFNLSDFKVTIGTSGLAVSGEKNTIGQFHITFSLYCTPQSLSCIDTPNINSHGILGNEKKA
jgi:hypothetical protein